MLFPQTMSARNRPERENRLIKIENPEKGAWKSSEAILLTAETEDHYIVSLISNSQQNKYDLSSNPYFECIKKVEQLDEECNKILQEKQGTLSHSKEAILSESDKTEKFKKKMVKQNQVYIFGNPLVDRHSIAIEKHERGALKTSEAIFLTAETEDRNLISLGISGSQENNDDLSSNPYFEYIKKAEQLNDEECSKMLVDLEKQGTVSHSFEAKLPESGKIGKFKNRMVKQNQVDIFGNPLVDSRSITIGNHERGALKSSGAILLTAETDDRNLISLGTSDSRENKDDLSSNPYFEYIRNAELLNDEECIKMMLELEKQGTSSRSKGDKLSESDMTVQIRKKTVKQNQVDIFGNSLTAKEKAKFTVNCPHCKKKVSAPSFVRHLSYCMKAGIRKRTKRSYESCR